MVQNAIVGYEVVKLESLKVGDMVKYCYRYIAYPLMKNQEVKSIVQGPHLKVTIGDETFSRHELIRMAFWRVIE